MPDDALLLHGEKVIENAILLISLPVRAFILAMNKAVVDVVRPQLLQLPVNRSFDRIQVEAPTISAAGIIRSEMNLVHHLIPDILQRLPEGGEGCPVPCRKVIVIDAALKCMPDRSYRILLIRLTDVGSPHTDLADLISRSLISPVSHQTAASCCCILLFICIR